MTLNEGINWVMRNGWPDGHGGMLYGAFAVTRYIHDMHQPIRAIDQAALKRGKDFVSKYL